jgi:hypothetical protein
VSRSSVAGRAARSGRPRPSSGFVHPLVALTLARWQNGAWFKSRHLGVTVVGVCIGSRRNAIHLPHRCYQTPSDDPRSSLRRPCNPGLNHAQAPAWFNGGWQSSRSGEPSRTGPARLAGPTTCYPANHFFEPCPDPPVFEIISTCDENPCGLRGGLPTRCFRWQPPPGGRPPLGGVTRLCNAIRIWVIRACELGFCVNRVIAAIPCTHLCYDSVGRKEGGMSDLHSNLHSNYVAKPCNPAMNQADRHSG